MRVLHMDWPSYGKPNGGCRILPSIYTTLRNTWVRATGQELAMSEMAHDGHIENTLNLLCESHGNVIDRSTDRIGRIANHFSNQPEIVDLLSQACLLMQRVDVRDMYPVADALNAELVKRRSDEIGLPTLPHPVRRRMTLAEAVKAGRRVGLFDVWPPAGYGGDG